MRKIFETARFFLIGPELVIVLLGFLAVNNYSREIQLLIANLKLSDELLKFLTAIPIALCVWSFVSGRKLLFPDKDKSSALQAWPDYWRLKIGFHVSLAWSVIFAAFSILAWSSDWKHPALVTWILLLTALSGSAFSTLSIYNAQTHVEEETSQLKAPKL